MKCEKQGCEAEATLCCRVGMRAFPERGEIVSTPILFLCPEHGEKVTLKDTGVFDDWAKIAENFVANGVSAPVKKLTKLKVTPIVKLDILDRTRAIAMGQGGRRYG